MTAPNQGLLSGKHSFPKSRRLLKSLEFKRVLDRGSKVVCPEIVMFALPRLSAGEQNTAGVHRLGLIVSKKVGKAIVRNQVKRRLREIFRGYSFQDALVSSMADPCVDFVIIARPAAAATEFGALATAFERCYMRLHKKREASKNATNDPNIDNTSL